MIRAVDPKECCGCTSCVSICPHQAITMQADSLGFLYPKFDKSKCVECGLCERVCNFKINYKRDCNFERPIAFAVRHRQDEEVQKSRSGASFVALSDYVLNNDGIVYGAGYDDCFRVVHKRAITKRERDEFRGSKYVQSDLTGVFKHVNEDLKEGKTVLFTGTPCQTAGLRSYIGKRNNNLFLVDIVCHGVPSPYIWRDYISYIEKKTDKKILSVNFRDKGLFGWKDHKETFLMDDGETIVGGLYTRFFYKHIMFRECCGNCYFTNLIRPSDITLGDLWGWEKLVPDMNKDNKGISLVLINTQKGRLLFEKALIDLNAIEVDVQKCMQPTLQRPTSIHPLRSEFEDDYAKYGFNFVKRKYVTPNILQKIYNKFKYGSSTL